MINYIFCKDDSYPSDNINILQFMLLKLLNKVKKTIDRLLLRNIVAISSPFIKDRRAITIWNHSVAMRLLYSSFEIHEHYALLAFIVSTNLIYLIISQ